MLMTFASTMVIMTIIMATIIISYGDNKSYGDDAEPAILINNKRF